MMDSPHQPLEANALCFFYFETTKNFMFPPPKPECFSTHTHTESHTRSHTQTQTAKKNSRVYKILILYYQVMCTFDVITITEEIIQPSL